MKTGNNYYNTGMGYIVCSLVDNFFFLLIIGIVYNPRMSVDNSIHEYLCNYEISTN